MSRYNIVFVILDDAHYDVFPKMPFLWSMPDGRWTRFPFCYFNNPYCGPSRGSIKTGRTCSSTGMIDHGTPTSSSLRTFINNYERDIYAAWVRAVGYRNLHIGKWLNQAPWDKGDLWAHPSYDAWFPQLDDAALGTGHENHTPSYVNYAVNENRGRVGVCATSDSWTSTGADATGRVITTLTDYFTDKLSSIAQQFIEDNASAPFFAWLSHRATHGSMLEGGGTGIQPAARHLSPFPVDASDIASRPGFNEADVSDKPAWVRDKPLLSAADITAEQSNQVDQWRCVHAVDESLRDLFAKAKAKGVFDNTIWIFMSDNGWLRGEHRLRKKNVCYEGSIRTELWIRHPEAPIGNQTINALIQNIDLTPFFCTATSAKPSRPMNGMDFTRLVTGAQDPATWRKTAYIESVDVDARGTPGFKGVVTATHKYVELDAFGGYPAETELYDLVADSGEEVNQTNNASFATIKADLAARLAVLKKAAVG